MRQLRMPSVFDTPHPPPAGIIGLAIGFGAQNPAQDVILGFFMILADQVMNIFVLDNLAISALMLRLRVKPRPNFQIEVRSESTATCEALL